MAAPRGSGAAGSGPTLIPRIEDLPSYVGEALDKAGVKRVSAINLCAFGAIILSVQYLVVPAIILVKSGSLIFPPMNDTLQSLRGGAEAAIVVALVISLAASLNAR